MNLPTLPMGADGTSQPASGATAAATSPGAASSDTAAAPSPGAASPDFAAATSPGTASPDTVTAASRLASQAAVGYRAAAGASASTNGARKRCFAPVIDANTRLLILGSLPGEQSLALQEYYGNRQNRFWMLMSAVLGTDLVALPYPQRLALLRDRGVGLWDVVAEAHREGSLDSKIRQRDDNDLPALLASHPAIDTIAFNGGTAAKLGRKVLGETGAHYRLVDLPSSSPAYTLAYADKLGRWLALRR